MTLITIFPYPDGTIISADSQETVSNNRGDEFKYSVLKLRPEKMGSVQVVIAGGDGDAIEAFIEDCKQSFADSTIDKLGDFKKALQSKLQQCRKNLRAVGDDSKMHLLIAAHTGQSYALWKSTSHVLRDVTEPDMIGFTDYMYRHTMKEYQPNNLPPTQLILLSLRILDFARQTSTCVDKPYSVVIVRNNGIHVFDGEITKQLVTNIEMFGAQINRLLLACGDTSIRSEVFTKQFEEFITTVQRLRRENMQEIGKREVSRMFEPGYSGDPISLTPLGTKFTMYDDAKSVIVSVEEESLEDIAWRREMMRQTEDKIEEMRLAKEKLTKLAEGYGEPLYEGNEQILLRPARPLA